MAIYRHDLGLFVERLPRAAFAILAAIRDQGSLDRAMDRVSAQPGLLRARDAGRVRAWFGLWTARGWFIRPLDRRQSRPTQGENP